MTTDQVVDEKPKDARQMSPAEYKAACAALTRAQPRRGVDRNALEKIMQGRKATELSREEYGEARKILSREVFL